MVGIIHFDHAIGFGIFHFFDPYHPVYSGIKGKVGTDKGIGIGHYDGPGQRIGGTHHRMTGSQRFQLTVNSGFGAQIFCYLFQFFFYGRTKKSGIPENIGNFFYGLVHHSGNFVDQLGHYGRSCYGQHRFGNRKAVGS